MIAAIVTAGAAAFVLNRLCQDAPKAAWAEADVASFEGRFAAATLKTGHNNTFVGEEARFVMQRPSLNTDWVTQPGEARAVDTVRGVPLPNPPRPVEAKTLPDVHANHQPRRHPRA